MKLLHRTRAACIGTVFACLLAAPALAKSPPPTWDGLEYRKTKGLDAVYVRPNVEFKAYKNVIIDPVAVAFDRNWDPNRDVRGTTGRLSTEDMEKLKSDMAAELRKVFAEELGKGGYQVVEQAGDETLRVTAGLAEVYITAPDTMSPGRSRTFVMDSGHMTLVMQLSDGPTGQLLARVVDQKAGSSTGSLQLSSSVTNSADFRRAVRSWAQRLVGGLDKVNGKTK